MEVSRKDFSICEVCARTLLAGNISHCAASSQVTHVDGLRGSLIDAIIGLPKNMLRVGYLLK